MENNRGDMVDSERIWYYWSKRKKKYSRKISSILNFINLQRSSQRWIETFLFRVKAKEPERGRGWRERERKNSGRKQGEGERKTFIPKDRITGQQLVFGKFGRGRVWKLFARQRGRRRSPRGNEFASRSGGGSREDRLTRKRSGSTLPLAGENGNEPFIR